MRSVKFAALLATAVMVLAGCATGNPQVAAYVDGSPISQAQVDQVSQAIVEASTDPAATAGDVSGVVLQIMIHGKIAEQVAAGEHYTVAASERQSLISANGLDGLAADPRTADFVTEFVDSSIILQNTDFQNAVAQAWATADVEVNPRFGTWNTQQNALEDGTAGGSISSLAPLKQG